MRFSLRVPLSRGPHPTFLWLELLRDLTILGVCAVAAANGAAQAKAPAKSSAPSKHFCQPDGGFCFSYPANWLVLGEVFGSGVVVAPQQTAERALWDVVTAAQVAPPPGENQRASSIDQIIDTAMKNMRDAGHNPETLQRQERTVDGMPAQMIRLRYHDDANGKDWIEELVFIDGPEHEIYSVGLKAQPENVARLEPAFAEILRSWKLPQAEEARVPPNR